MLWIMLPVALAADVDWKVDDPHGPSHEATLDLDEGTWTSVTVHGDHLVFDLLGDLWTVGLAGGEATRLTSGAAWDCEPRFSPDGQWVAFVSDRGGNEQLWVMKPDGTEARQLTDEDEARVTEPVWDGSDWVIGRRRTVDTRSIGVFELWRYHVQGGKGTALTSKDEHPHAGEAVLDDHYLYFSTRHGRFDYNENPVAGLWHVQRRDRITGEERPVVTGPGSATRPILSPDGREIFFVSRDRTLTLLEAMDLETGERRVVADWLSPDEMEAFAIHETYPAMDWTDDGDLVLWAQGKLWRLDVHSGERVEIPYRARGTWTLADVTRPERHIPDTVDVKVVRWPRPNAAGQIAFSALGVLWLREPDGTIRRVSEGTGYSPAWSPDGETLAWTSWSDTEGGRLHLTRGKKTETLPVRGQLVNPSFGEDGRIVVLRGPGEQYSPDLGNEAWFEVVLLEKQKKEWTSSVVTTVDARGPASRAQQVRLHDGRVWLQEDVEGEPRTPPGAALVSLAPDGTDKRTILEIPEGAEEIVPSPDWRWVAYKSRHQLHVVPLPQTKATVEELPDRKVTTIVGDWIGWSPDGRSVTWMEGPVYKSKPLDKLYERKDEDEEEAEKDPFLEEDVTSLPIALSVPRERPGGTLALTHARVITMDGDEVLDDATIVIERDRIVAVGPDVPVPVGATVRDVSGKTVIPGFVDVHAHLHYTAGDVLPEQEWRYLTNLEFGVTTVHDPSASTDTVFTQAERVAAGFEKGPRVYSTGYILYGAKDSQNADTPDIDAARAHVRRLKAVGAISVKVYQQSQRERRQWYVQVCREEQVLCVPEGGGDLWMDLGMVADGFSAMEHALSTSPLRADVRAFLAASHTADTQGTFYTPTLLVAYGGLFGENWFYQHLSPLDDERLLRHFPRRELDARAWRLPIWARDGDWRFQSVAADAGKLVDAGVHVTLGAHGQLQGLGVHWELWALASKPGLTPHQALRAATVEGARYLGLEGEIGTVEAGKLADLVVLDADPLEDVHNSTAITFVVANGEVVE